MTTRLFEPKRTLEVPAPLVALNVVSAAAMGLAVYQIFFLTPIETQMGFIQKIFYFHVPAAWIMFMAVALSAVGSVGYLVQRSDRWDRLGDAAVELAILFGVMVLVTGPLWGRKAWGAYWVWDVRLTSSLVLVLTLVACKIVRGYAGPSAKQIAAGLALFAVINSVFVYVSVNIWRGTHPNTLITKGGLAPEMLRTFLFCLFTFTLAFLSLLFLRLRMSRLRTALDRLHLLSADSGLDG